MTATTEGGWNEERGTSLPDAIERSGSLPPAAALLMLDDILERVEQIEAAGAAHVELQPAVVRINEYGRVGLNVPPSQIGVGPVPSPAAARYAAPEVRGGGPIDARAYVYSATAVFVEALTGMPPDIGRDVISSAPGATPTHQMDNPAPPAVRRLVDAGLAGEPAQRLGTPDALRALLAEVAAECFPAEDWRSRGRAWLSTAAPEPIKPASTTMQRRVLPWETQPVPGAENVVVPEYTAPGFVEEQRESGPAPGLFRRMARGDPGVITGFGIILVGLVLVIIGASVAGSLTGPRTTAAAAPQAQSTPSDNAQSTPSAAGSEFLSTPIPTPYPTGTPNPTPSTSPSPVPTPLPSDNSGGTTFFAGPTPTPEPTPLPACTLPIILCPPPPTPPPSG